MTEEQIVAVHNYLQKNFPNADINDQLDFDRHGHKFSVTTKNEVLLTSISGELSSGYNKDKLIEILENYGLTKMLKEHPESTIIVTSKRIYDVPRI